MDRKGDEFEGLQPPSAARYCVQRWGQSFTIDGFGNPTGQTVAKGSAPSMSITVEASTNRIRGRLLRCQRQPATAPIAPAPSVTTRPIAVCTGSVALATGR